MQLIALCRHASGLAYLGSMLTNIRTDLETVLTFQVLGCIGETQICLNTGLFQRLLHLLTQCP